MSPTEHVLVMYVDRVTSGYSRPTEKLRVGPPRLENKSFARQSISIITLCHCLVGSLQPILDATQ